MSPLSVEIFRPSVESKLREKGVRKGDHIAARKALSRCVMGAQLITAYNKLNNTECSDDTEVQLMD